MFRSLLACPVGYREQITKWLFILLLCLVSLNITACDYGQPKKPKNKFSQPPFETSKNITIEKQREVAALVSEKNDGDEKISVEKVSIFNNKNEMAAPKGLLTEVLFNAPVAGDPERFERLENAVQSLSDKLNKMSPTIQRLSDIDRDLENLTYQLEILVNERDDIIKKEPEFRDAALKIPPSAPLPKEKAKIIEAKIPVPPQDIAPASGGNATQEPDIISGGSGSSVIDNLRIADHDGKTRLVFEGSEKMDVIFNLNPNGRSATAEIKNSSLNINPESIQRKSSLIRNASIKDNTLQLILNEKSEKIGQGYLPPTNSNPNHRFYIDLKS